MSKTDELNDWVEYHISLLSERMSKELAERLSDIEVEAVLYFPDELAQAARMAVSIATVSRLVVDISQGLGDQGLRHILREMSEYIKKTRSGDEQD